ncbi:cysteine hydrolase family protein [Georgenia sp. AZ-5]|uniref:cysteine hydrolase family protein n=1 Tax=Georgenia sp. AZ-5 TaxID=3367526 RepID=UPI003754A924
MKPGEGGRPHGAAATVAQEHRRGGASSRPAEALLVLDMQNGFLHRDGALYQAMGHPLHEIERTIEANARAIRAAQDAGMPIIATRHRYREGYVDAPALSRERFRTMDEGALLAGTWDADLVQDLPLEHAILLDKVRMDAFFGTPLESLLRQLGVTSVFIGGVVTNACVETTARSAAMRDFRVTVLADCCTTATEADQDASLSSLARFGLADVRQGEEVF